MDILVVKRDTIPRSWPLSSIWSSACSPVCSCFIIIVLHVNSYSRTWNGCSGYSGMIFGEFCFCGTKNYLSARTSYENVFFSCCLNTVTFSRDFYLQRLERLVWVSYCETLTLPFATPSANASPKASLEFKNPT